MTVYAFDESRPALITTWDIGDGCVAGTLAELPDATPVADAFALASSLTGLSRWIWRTYTHPASAADSLEVSSEGWRRQGERDAFADVIPAIRVPNLPEAGGLLQSYVMVEEAAHRVGRALHAIGNQALTDHVTADVEQELASVEQAERGDLSGRARQAVVLTRADASPVQVLAADDLLRAHPLGSKQLFKEVDPTAAAVAAAHWLQAAADVASDVADCDPTTVVYEADNIEALAVETPTLVLKRLNGGAAPRDVVIELVTAAMVAAEGRIPDPEMLTKQIEEARRKAERHGPGDDAFRAALMPRIVRLDPARPSQDLLEDLLDGIRGCWLLYREYTDDADDGFGDMSDDERDDIAEQIDEDFFESVRAEAAENKDRLL